MSAVESSPSSHHHRPLEYSCQDTPPHEQGRHPYFYDIKREMGTVSKKLKYFP